MRISRKPPILSGMSQTRSIVAGGTAAVLIFERFQRGRADRNGRRADGGAGLGLPIVAAHHGTVRLERPPHATGTGAVFVLDLPAVDLTLDGRSSDMELLEQR